MNEKDPALAAPDKPADYEIRLKGRLDAHWAAYFAGMTMTLDAKGNTRLTGPVVDQSALYGLLRKVRDLGMPLLSVICLETDQIEK